MHALSPIPLVIITGHRGVGKTTWLNRVLQDNFFSQTLVIMNEKGQEILSHSLVKYASHRITAVRIGCPCCNLRSNLTSNIENILRDKDNNRIPFFNKIIVETAGTEDPIPILHLFAYHPYISKRFEVKGTITLVDQQDNQKNREELGLSPQICQAQILLMTKKDNMSKEELEIFKEKLESTNQSAKVMAVDAFKISTMFEDKKHSDTRKH